MAAIEKISYLILAVFAFVIIIIGILLISKTLYSNITFFFEKEKILEESRPNIDILLRNLEACDDVNDYLCICEIFPNFPSSLPSSFFLRSRIIKTNGISFGRNVSIDLKNQVIDSRRINKEFGVFLNGKWDFSLPIEKIEIEEIDFEINFKEAYPIIEKWNIFFFVVSPFMLKDRTNLYFIGIISALRWNDVKDDIGDLSKIVNEKIKEFPKCKEKRQENIYLFESLIRKIESGNQQDGNQQEIEINIDGDFYIEVGKNISLFDSEGVVKRIKQIESIKIFEETRVPRELTLYSLNVRKAKSEIDEKWKVEEVSVNKDYRCNGNDITLKKGDKIKVKKENGKICIEKV